MAGAAVTLVVPGLLGPMPGWLQSDDTPRFPRLERWLARADRAPAAGDDLASTLLPLFGLERPPGADLPVAALSRLGEGGEADDLCWLLAHPVCLRPDQSRLLLFDTLDFDFTLAEAEALAALFRDHFSDRGWRLEVAAPGRWYLGLERCPALATRSLGAVFGRNMDLFLPAGEERLAWHRLLNEVQMLFFQAPLNREREARGAMPVNGLWFSGVGRLPPVAAAPFDRVFGDAALLQGVARHAGVPAAPLPGPGECDLDPARRPLLLYDRLERPVWCADPHAWAGELERFEQWLAGWIDALARRELASLQIHSCDGSRWRLRRGALRRFWRRPRELLRLAQGAV